MIFLIILLSLFKFCFDMEDNEIYNGCVFTGSICVLLGIVLNQSILFLTGCVIVFGILIWAIWGNALKDLFNRIFKGSDKDGESESEIEEKD